MEKNKPIIISTGMSTLKEIECTYNYLKKKESIEFAFLHCNSTYPSSFHNLNLNFIEEMKRKFDVLIGYSSHEPGIVVPIAALCKGACIIEKHLTLDRSMKGPDHGSSLEPQGLIKLVRDIRNVELSFGSKHKWVSRGEILNKEVLSKSLIAKDNIKKGEIITKNLIGVKSPAKGISPQKIDLLINKKSIRSIKKDEFFMRKDFGIRNSLHFKKITNKKIGFIVRFNDIGKLDNYDIDGYEFHFSDMDVNVNKISKIKKMFKQELIVHAPEYWGDSLIDLASKDKKILEMSRYVIYNTIDITKRISKYFFGSKNKKIKLIIHPGGISRGDININKEVLYDILSKSISDIKDQNIELLLENMPPLPWYFGGQWVHNIFMDSEEIIDFCKNNRTNIIFDISHSQLYCNYKKINIYDYTKQLIPYIKHIHVADAAGWDGEGLQIGEGEIDFKKFFNLIKELDVIIVPEIWQGHKFGGEDFIKAIDKLKDYLK